MDSLTESLEWADVVVIGPGLGQKEWGKKALKKVENFRKRRLWDAEACNMRAISPEKLQNRVNTTPHSQAERWGVRLCGYTASVRQHGAPCVATWYGRLRRG
ncbi:carbohydrate kinase [Escherichia coli]|nr:carbohydrate kinase [Escherichia coli]